jgi:hypothetical protein
VKHPTPRWSLNPAEVDAAMMGTTTSGRSQRRESRALDVRSVKLTLKHRPTGVVVVGAVPDGHYARKEMTRLKAELRAGLFRELESKVARVLRIPGRCHE